VLRHYQHAYIAGARFTWGIVTWRDCRRGAYVGVVVIRCRGRRRPSRAGLSLIREAPRTTRTPSAALVLVEQEFSDCRRHVKTDPVSERRKWVNFRVPLTVTRSNWRLPAAVPARARQLVPYRRASRRAGWPAAPDPDRRLPDPRGRRRGAGKASRAERPGMRCSRLDDRAVAGDMAHRPSVTAPADPQCLPAAPGLRPDPGDRAASAGLFRASVRGGRCNVLAHDDDRHQDELEERAAHPLKADVDDE
jgi:hypothetical protein